MQLGQAGHPRAAEDEDLGARVPGPLRRPEERRRGPRAVVQFQDAEAGADHGRAVRRDPGRVQAVLDQVAGPFQGGDHAVAAAEQAGQVGGGLGDVHDRGVQKLTGRLPPVFAEPRHHHGVIRLGIAGGVTAQRVQYRGCGEIAVEPALGRLRPPDGGERNDDRARTRGGAGRGGDLPRHGDGGVAVGDENAHGLGGVGPRYHIRPVPRLPPPAVVSGAVSG